MNFKKLPNGLCDGFVLVKKCEVKKTKNGASYLDLVIGDKGGEMPAKLWDFSGEPFEEESVVKIRGTVEQYNGKDQFRISQIRPVAETDNYDLSELVPASEVGGRQIYDMLMKRVSAFSDKDFKAVVTDIMESKKDILVTCPAAFRLHHAMIGGLMLHTMSIVRMAEQICKIYPNVNMDLLLAGAILHDAAKTWEFTFSKTGLVNGYSVGGELIGHLVEGAIWVEESAKKLGVPQEKAQLLEHMVLSHHGVPEFGSPVRPMFLEAQILSALDTLDAQIFEFHSATSKVDPGKFTDRQWSLESRKLFNHGLSGTEHIVNLED